MAALGPVESGAEFVLHRDRQSANELSYVHSLEYVVAFAQSVRGLVPGAPVEYRGIRVGSVRAILIAPLTEANLRGRTAQPIPVLISIEPGRLGIGDTAEGVERMLQVIERGVRARMRASLESANLLTGALLISIDYYPEEEAGEIGDFAGYQTLPTVSGGFERIERQVSAFLEKLNDMPLEATVRELNGILDDLREVTGSDKFQDLPGTLTAVLDSPQARPPADLARFATLRSPVPHDHGAEPHAAERGRTAAHAGREAELAHLLAADRARSRASWESPVTRVSLRLVLLLCLVSCASAPPEASYYLLRVEPPVDLDSTDPLPVALGRIAIPPYLDRVGLVVQNGRAPHSRGALPPVGRAPR